MNERERFMKLLREAEAKCANTGQCRLCEQYGKGGDCQRELTTDYLLANGALCPPCKVGSAVYRIVEMGTGVHYKQVGRCGIGHAKGYKIVPCEEKTKRFIRSVVVTKNNFFDVYENWGKTVFLTREEAEKALAERSKE